ADPVACRHIWRVRPAVRPVAAWRSGHEIRMRTHEPPDEPFVRTAERAEALGQVRDDLLFQTWFSRERDRKLRDRLGIDALADLKSVPRAALQILGRDRVREEVARAHQVKRAAHQPGSYDGVRLLDRAPQALALEVPQARPEREIWGRRPLRLQSREALDPGDDRQRRALEAHPARAGRPVEPAHRELERIGGPARAHASTPGVFTP